MDERRFPTAREQGLQRRRWLRFATGGHVSARITAFDVHMPVHDVSYGGFATDSPTRFAIGEMHEFLLLMAGDGEAVRVRARAVRTVPAGERHGEPLFRTGWEALGDRATTAALIALVERVTNAREEVT